MAQDIFLDNIFFQAFSKLRMNNAAYTINYFVPGGQEGGREGRGEGRLYVRDMKTKRWAVIHSVRRAINIMPEKDKILKTLQMFLEINPEERAN